MPLSTTATFSFGAKPTTLISTRPPGVILAGLTDIVAVGVTTGVASAGAAGTAWGCVTVDAARTGGEAARLPAQRLPTSTAASARLAVRVRVCVRFQSIQYAPTYDAG